MVTWFFPVMAVIILYGLMTFLPKLALQSIDPVSAMIYEVLGGMVVGLALLCWVGFKPEFSWSGSIISFIVGLCGFGGTLAFFIALTKGPVSLITPLTSFYPLFAVLLAVIFLKETLSIENIIGIALAVISVFLISK